ncbi:hypothetical protein ACTFIT_007684 [Dictyostelium discoideum]
MFSSKILGLIAVGAIFIATNPKEKETFANQLQEKTKKESGFIAVCKPFTPTNGCTSDIGWAAKGMALLDLFTIEDHIFFSLAFLNPPPHSTDSVVAIGFLKNWFFIKSLNV